MFSPTFRFLNFVINPTSFTLAQDIGIFCATYTSLTLLATINVQSDGVIVKFCVNPTTCSTPQNILAGTGDFLEYSASFQVPSGADVTASVNLATNFESLNFAGIGKFEVLPS
jgi:hypothetical protein